MFDRSWLAGQTTSLLLVVLIAYGLRIFRLDFQSMWWDEVFTGAVASLPFWELITETLADRVHPPLYGLVMHLWIRIGFDAFSLRYFSLAWGVLAVPLAYRVGRLVDGHRTGLVAAFLLATSPFHIWFSQDARMYSLVAALVLAAHWFLLRAIGTEKRRDWLGYAAFMILALYTHYLAIFTLLAQYAFFALNYRRGKGLFLKWVKHAGVAAVLFGFWGLAIMLTGGFEQASISWVPPARWTHPLLTLLVFSAGSTINRTNPAGYAILALFLGASIAVLAKLKRPRGDEAATLKWMMARVLLSWLVLPISLVWLISLDLPIPQKRSIYMDRYLIILQPAFLILAAWGLGLLSRGKSGLLAATLILIGLLTVPSLKNLYFDPAFARTDWQAAVAKLEADWGPGDKVLLRQGQVLPFLYYSKSRVPYQVLPTAPNDNEQNSDDEILKAIGVAAAVSDRVWLMDTVANIDPHGFPQARNEELVQVVKNSRLRRWLEAHYTRTKQWTSSGIALVLYEAK